MGGIAVRLRNCATHFAMAMHFERGVGARFGNALSPRNMIACIAQLNLGSMNFETTHVVESIVVSTRGGLVLKPLISYPESMTRG